jgi:acyl carrier protein
MNDQPFETKLAEILGIEDVGDDTGIVPEEWDSVVVLDLIAAIDESYGVTVATNDLNQCRTAGDLRARIRSAVAAVPQ